MTAARRPSATTRAACWLAVVGIALTASGCFNDLRNQPRYEPLEPSDFFANGQSSRPLVAGTIARGELDIDSPLQTGKENGELVSELPMKFDRTLLLRGQERFNIYCTPCHDRTGSGNGMVVQRGFRRPPSYHLARLRQAPIGHFFDVVTNGFGAMPSLAVQIPPEDRWAIAAYVRALQLSQNAQLSDVPVADRAAIEGGGS